MREENKENISFPITGRKCRHCDSAPATDENDLVSDTTWHVHVISAEKVTPKILCPLRTLTGKPLNSNCPKIWACFVFALNNIALYFVDFPLYLLRNTTFRIVVSLECNNEPFLFSILSQRDCPPWIRASQAIRQGWLSPPVCQSLQREAIAFTLQGFFTGQPRYNNYTALCT